MGKSMAVRFAELGANLVLTSRRQDVLDETSAEINEATGAKILTVAADIRSPEQVADMVTQSVSRFKKIDGLLNNAAGNFISPTEKLSENAFKTIVEIVLLGSFNCTLNAGRK